ncbi:MAG: TlpA family protein disulfide reductase [Gammaproteobacteria bacterium]|nr:TlpA family protein disulfide reductase [Gammaproteobacteria bacterium]
MNFAEADAVFYDTKGHTVQLSLLRGKWIIINYWADWCGACRQEIPELNHFYKRIKDMNILFYGVNFDDLPLEELKAATESVGIQFPSLTSDPGSAWNLDNVDAIPTTFIINPEGRVAKVITGTTTEDDLLNTINTLQHSRASN